SLDCSASDSQRVEDLIRSAITNETVGNIEGAIDALNRARQLDPLFAETQFRLGRCLLRGGAVSQAREAFRNARDYDALPFRADSEINNVIRQIALKHAGRRVALADVEAKMREHSRDGIPGNDLFFEHVHFSFRGNYLVARTLAEMVDQHAPPAAPRKNAWATQEECDRLLALTDWNRIGVIENVLRRIQAPPFVGQVNHDDQVEYCRSQLRAVRSRLGSQDPGLARELYKQALVRRPRDHYLYENFAEFLEATGDIQGAIVQWESICGLVPNYFVPHVHAGRLLAREQKWTAAEAHLRKALELEPRSSEGHLELAKVLAGRNQIEAALAEFNEAMRWGPGNAMVYFHLADVLAKIGRRAEAIEALTKAVQLQPSFWEARYLLGVELAMNNRLAEAQHQFEQTIRWRPNHVLAHLNLGVAYALQGRLEAARLEFEETLRLDPQNQKAKEHLAKIEAILRAQAPVER
ncbi:MAG: tetratricopeptide repeat protein, partial [Verrucomicrobiae bacterium]|nr:tetratricopeptide repeat protein [Verrucomicrobiae bacterium]